MNTTSVFRVALVSMPWSIFNRPSVQLGTLQSYLNNRQGYKAETYYPYLHIAKAIGLDTYSKITLSGWAGEALFSPLLFPEKYEDAKKLYTDSLNSDSTVKSRKEEFDSITTTLKDTCTTWLNSTDVLSSRLIGFSVCFSQLLPSLYLARLIKAQNNKVKIVFGGSSCSGELGKSLVRHFKEVDYVVSGEGEKALLSLCNHLIDNSSELPKNIYSSQSSTKSENLSQQPPPEKELDLNDLPIPDYREYFQEMSQLFPGSPFIPVIPIEFSRGCWWNKCSFCNLNIQWKNYRFKSGEKMVTEVLQLCRTYESLNLAFTDNALPPKEADFFFHELRQHEIDFNFFAEIRAALHPEQLRIYSRGGLTTVQVGIEALSTSLLKKMTKGSSAIENIAIIKMASQYGIQVEGNLIVEFPSASEEEIQETLNALDYLFPFRPLDTATFFLGYDSPVYCNHKNYSIDSILHHDKNKKLFPKDILSTMTMLLHSYRGDRKIQQKQWKPVRKKVRQWKDFHDKRSGTEHPLSYRDGKTFLIIRQEQTDGPVLQHRLRGLSRKIYLACETTMEIKKLNTMFPQVKEQALMGFISEMCRKRLMFEEQGFVLALAIHNASMDLSNQPT